jgi:hypothetical protein
MHHFINFLKNTIHTLEKSAYFLNQYKPFSMIITVLIIFYLYNNFKEGLISGRTTKLTTKCKQKVGKFCGNEKDSPKTQASNFIKNLETMLRFYLDIIADNLEGDEEVFKASMITATQKYKKQIKKYKDFKKPKKWIVEDGERKEKIEKKMIQKTNTDSKFKENITKLVERVQKMSERLQKIKMSDNKFKFFSASFIKAWKPLETKTLYEANGVSGDGFLYRKNYLQDSFIYAEEALKSCVHLFDMIETHNLYTNDKFYRKK